MRKYYSQIFVLVILLFSQNLFAQSQDQTFSRFRLLLRNGDRIEGKNGVLTIVGLEGTSKTGKPLNIPINDIRVLDRYAGSQAGEGAAIGAGMGLLTGLLVIIQIEADRYRELSVNGRALTAGLTLGGALIGLVVGSGSAKWERVPLKTALQIKPHNKGVMVMIEVLF